MIILLVIKTYLDDKLELELAVKLELFNGTWSSLKVQNSFFYNNSN